MSTQAGQAQIRIEAGLSSLGSEQLSRLALVQEEFGSRLSALQDHLTSELLALSELSVEWTALHQEGWEIVKGLGLESRQAQTLLVNRGIDPAPLLRVLHPPEDRERQEHYPLPLRAQQAPTDLPGKVEKISGHLLLTGLGTVEAERSDLVE